MEHRNLGATTADVVRQDLEQSRKILTERCGSVKHFAFPYGRFTDLSPQGFKDVFSVGYESCASAERGCHIANGEVSKEDLCLRRDHVVLDWPLSHVRYFLANNALKASAANNHFPA
jgi:peptidoglycan/xylan/chitin deacetylase (PgdA/CDA1 family)